jgi:hypothetical protein
MGKQKLSESEVLDLLKIGPQSLKHWNDLKLIPPAEVDEDGKRVWDKDKMARWLAARPVWTKDHIARPNDGCELVTQMRRHNDEIHIVKTYVRA